VTLVNNRDGEGFGLVSLGYALAFGISYSVKGIVG
jgi:hypothetical protein